MRDAVVPGAIFVLLFDQECVEGLQILLRDLVDVDPFAGLLKQFERETIRLVRFWCQLRHIGQILANLFIQTMLAFFGGWSIRLVGLERKGDVRLSRYWTSGRLAPCGVCVGAQRFPCPLAHTLDAHVVGRFGMVFWRASDKAPERADARLAVVEGGAVGRLFPIRAAESEIQIGLGLTHSDFPLFPSTGFGKKSGKSVQAV